MKGDHAHGRDRAGPPHGRGVAQCHQRAHAQAHQGDQEGQEGEGARGRQGREVLRQVQGAADQQGDRHGPAQYVPQRRGARRLPDGRRPAGLRLMGRVVQPRVRGLVRLLARLLECLRVRRRGRGAGGRRGPGAPLRLRLAGLVLAEEGHQQGHVLDGPSDGGGAQRDVRLAHLVRGIAQQGDHPLHVLHGPGHGGRAQRLLSGVGQPAVLLQEAHQRGDLLHGTAGGGRFQEGPHAQGVRRVGIVRGIRRVRGRGVVRGCGGVRGRGGVGGGVVGGPVAAFVVRRRESDGVIHRKLRSPTRGSTQSRAGHRASW